MRAVTRDPAKAPAALSARYGRPKRSELERAADHYAAQVAAGATKIKTYGFSRYKLAEVKDELDQIFHGKCAYCESAYAATHPVDVEHYRPKGPVDGVVGHPGYWWLAADWENLLPSCIDCNRKRGQITPQPMDWSLLTLNNTYGFDHSKEMQSGKQSAFPLAPGSVHVADGSVPAQLDAEARLLLDPTRDAPGDHIGFYVDRDNLISLVYPKPLDPAVTPGLPPAIRDIAELQAQANQAQASPIGAVSIQIYGLNRLGLVQARTRLLRELDFLAIRAVELDVLRQQLQECRDDREARQQLPNTTPAEVAALKKDIDIDDQIIAKLDDMVASFYQEIAEKADARSPYSALAAAWIDTFVDSA